MAKKTFTVTVAPTEVTVYEIEASNRKAATNKAFRQWRDEVAKNHDNIEVVRGSVIDGEDTTEDETDEVQE